MYTAFIYTRDHDNKRIVMSKFVIISNGLLTENGITKNDNNVCVDRDDEVETFLTLRCICR